VVLSLWYAVGNANTVCSALGEEPPYNDGTNNYAIAPLELLTQLNIDFPYAIGQCTSHSIATTGGPYYIHTCTDSGLLSTQQYSDSACSQVVGKAVESNSADQYSVGETGFYLCGGDNTFVELSIATGTSADGDKACSNLQTIFGGLNGCMDNIQTFGQMLSIYCNSTVAILEWFSDVSVVNGRNDLDEFISSGFPQSSQNAITTTATENINTGTGVGPSIPSTTSTNPGCPSKSYCNDWPVPNNGECNSVVISQPNLLWGSMIKCTGTTGEGNTKDATRIYLTLWTGLVAAIFALVL